jgi:dTMP kinase
VPDLAVILTAEPTVTAHRIDLRGAHSRFENGIITSHTETGLYQDTIARLTERGYPLLSLDTTDTPSAQIADAIATRIAALAGIPPADTATA